MADPAVAERNEGRILCVDFDCAVSLCIYFHGTEFASYSSSLLFWNGLERARRNTFTAYSWYGYPVWCIHEQLDSSKSENTSRKNSEKDAGFAVKRCSGTRKINKDE